MEQSAAYSEWHKHEYHGHYHWALFLFASGFLLWSSFTLARFDVELTFAQAQLEYADGFENDPYVTRWRNEIRQAVWDSVDQELDIADDNDVLIRYDGSSLDTIDHEAQVTARASTGRLVGPGVRMSSAGGGHGYGMTMESGGINIYRWSTGVRTGLTTFTMPITFTAGNFYTMRLAASGGVGASVVLSVWVVDHGPTKPVDPGWIGSDASPQRTFTDSTTIRLDDATKTQGGIAGRASVSIYDHRHDYFKIRAISARGGTSFPALPPPTSDTTTPTVSVTTPSNGYTVSGAFTNVTANATDNFGVAGVTFRLDGSSFGAEDTSAPYSIDWNTTLTSNGTHILTALARDTSGNSTISPGVTVTVSNTTAPPPLPGDTTLPVVSVTLPLIGSTVSGATATLSASATDNIGVSGVQFRLDGANIGAEDTTFPYSITWNTTIASNGSHTLTAVARDAAGNTTTSSNISVTVSNVTAPPPSTGSNNPDNWPVATATYVSRDYNTQVANDMWPESAPLVIHEYMPTGGLNGSGAWKVTPTPIASGFNEDNAGWNVGAGSSAVPAGTNTMVIEYKIFLSGQLLNDIVARPGGFWAHNNKTFDVFMRGQSGGFDDTTRQVIGFTNDNNGARFSHMKGGAGTHLYNDGVNVNPDWRAYADQWVQVIHVFDRSGTFTYIKAPNDTGVRKILQRRSTDSIPGDGGEPYTYNPYGWTLEPGRPLWGYWDDISGTSFDAQRFVKIDELRVHNGWPATFSSLPPPTTPLPTTPTPPTRFSINDRVQITSNVQVRQRAAGTSLGTQPAGVLSFVANGPTYASLSGTSYWWWNLNFDTGLDGWVVDDFLSPYTPPTPPPTGDITPPSVSITTPSSGSTVSTSAVTISANASDNVGVSGVQFRLDGVNLGIEDTTAPYSITWNTTTASNGSHTLSAVARDAAGNTNTSSSINVTVSNVVTPPPSGAGLLFFDNFDYVVNKFDSATAKRNAFTSAGWDGLKDEQTRPGGASGYLSTVTSIPGYSGSFPGGGSRVLLLEGLPTSMGDVSGAPGTYRNQTDFYLSKGTPGPVGRTSPPPALPGNYWMQFWIYINDFGTERSHWAPRNKLIYPSDDGTSAGIGGESSGIFHLRPSNQAGVVQPYGPNANFVGHIQSQTVISNAPEGADRPGYNVGNVTLVANRWYLVKFHSDTSQENGTYEAWIKQAGGTFTKVSEWISGVTPGFTWITYPALRNGQNMFKMPTTWGTAQEDDNTNYDAWLYMDDFAMATSESALPTYSGTTPPSDTTPPTSSITAPTSGSTVSSSAVTVSANASDNVGVSGVQFRLDGANLGTEDTTAPYSISWNTTLASNGTHTLTAVARDAAGNTGTSLGVTVTVSNTTLPPPTTPPPTSANYPLQIIQPQPNLNTNSRYYKAYPGINYEVPVGVFGGAYPFTYSLVTAPSGMTIDQNGVVSWSNPTTSTSGSPHSVTVRVTDAVGTSVTRSWTITVTTQGFLFIDGTNGTHAQGFGCTSNCGTGTLTNPFRSMNDVYQNNPSVAESWRNGAFNDHFIYWRGGTYGLEGFFNGNDVLGWSIEWRGDAKPHVWLAYPGEAVTIDHNFAPGSVYPGAPAGSPGAYIDWRDGNSDDAFIQGITFRDAGNHIKRMNGDRIVLFENTFFNLGPGMGGANSSFIMFSGPAALTEYYPFVKNNLFDTFTEGAFIKTYGTYYGVFEGNTFRNGSDSTEGLAIKGSDTYMDVRGNTFDGVFGGGSGGSISGNQHGAANLEIRFNNIMNAPIGSPAIRINHDGIMDGPVYVHRNTFEGEVLVRSVDSADGPFNIYHNVIVNPSTWTPPGSGITQYAVTDQSRITAANNLVGTPSQNIIDSNGNLTSAYNSYLGTYGYQVVGGASPTPPPPPPPPPTTPPPTGAPIVSNLSVQVRQGEARFRWNTDHPATSQVDYGLTTAYGLQSPVNAILRTSHEVVVPNLVAGNYNARSVSIANNLSGLSPNTTFTVRGRPPRINIISVSPGSIILNWSAISFPGYSGVAILRSTTGYINQYSASSEIARVTGTTYTDDNVIPGITYYYSLFVYDDQENYSDPATVSFVAPVSSSPTIPTPPAPPVSSGGGGGGGGSSSAPSSGLLLPPNFNYLTQAQKISVLTAKILELQIIMNTLFGAGGAQVPVSTSSCSFTRDLSLGSVGEDVRCLQKYLNANGFAVAVTGNGSLGNESTYFGPSTRSAVLRWQKTYGIIPSSGYFGSKSKIKYSQLPK